MHQQWGSLSRRCFMGIVGAAAWTVGSGGLPPAGMVDARIGAPLFPAQGIEALGRRMENAIRYIHMDCGAARLDPAGRTPEQQLYAGLLSLALLVPGLEPAQVSVLGRWDHNGIPVHVVARLAYPRYTAILTLGRGDPALVVRAMDGSAYRLRASAHPGALPGCAVYRVAGNLYAQILESSPFSRSSA